VLLLERYFSFNGRLARFPFFVRGIYLTIAAFVPMVVSIPLFANGRRVLWWIGMAVVVASIAAIVVSSASLTIRRLHDLGLSGYHAIWVGAAEVGWTALSYGPQYAILLGLPLFAIGLWLLLYPGNAGANRFGNQ
jgi:uncharacterized membrane protein YhaH (DUF805 family)